MVIFFRTSQANVKAAWRVARRTKGGEGNRRSEVPILLDELNHYFVQVANSVTSGLTPSIADILCIKLLEKIL